MSNTVYIATSLDGYIARKDGTLDWLINLPNPTQSDYGFSLFLDRMDGIIMGRKSFETVMGFDEWPYVKPLPVFVLSNTLSELPARFSSRAEIVKGELQTILDTLRQRGIRNLYVDGGMTIQAFLKEDLIDEMIITRAPILLGGGIPLFGNHPELEFRHDSTEVLNGMLVRSRYFRLR